MKYLCYNETNRGSKSVSFCLILSHADQVAARRNASRSSAVGISTASRSRNSPFDRALSAARLTITLAIGPTYRAKSSRARFNRFASQVGAGGATAGAGAGVVAGLAGWAGTEGFANAW